MQMTLSRCILALNKQHGLDVILVLILQSSEIIFEANVSQHLMHCVLQLILYLITYVSTVF